MELDESQIEDEGTDDQSVEGQDPEEQTAGAPADEASDGEAEQTEGEADEGDVPSESRSKRRAKRHIRQLKAQIAEERENNRKLNERLEALEKRVGPEPEPPRPVRDDFETEEEYEDARDEWRDQVKALRSAKPTDEKVTPKTTQTEGQVPDETAQKFFDAVKEIGGDEAFDEVMNGDWQCSQAMTMYITSADRGPELAIHLADNPEAASRIFKLTPLKAFQELEKLEAGLPAGKKPGAASAAPPPATPVRSSGTPSVDEDSMSDSEWVKHRRAQLQKRRSARYG